MPDRQQQRSVERQSAVVGAVLSCAVHSLLLLSVGFVKPYEFEFELSMPTEVEFGVTEAVQMVRVSNPVNSPAVPETETVAETVAGAETKAETETRTDAETEEALVAEPTLEGPSRIPAGAHLALRMDMARVRRSPLAADVNRFLAAVPDWQLLLAGSGIDPVADLERLLIATPNLERAKLIIAGKHRRGGGFTNARVKALADARGKKAPWKRTAGLPTARWHNLDATERVIALLSPTLFSITRPNDLPRLLALAQVRQKRDAAREGLEEVSGAEALISMGPGEALSFEVEGVHRFVTGNAKHVPQRLRVAVRETGPNQATIDALATYASVQEAASAVAFWQRERNHYAQQPLIHLMSLGSVLTRMKLDADGERLRMTTQLNAQQIRMVLAYIEGALGGSRMEAQPTRPRVK